MGAASRRPDALLDPLGASRRPWRNRLRVGDLAASCAGRMDRMVRRRPRRQHRARPLQPSLPASSRRARPGAGVADPAHGHAEGGGRLGVPLFGTSGGGLHPCRRGTQRILLPPCRLDCHRADQRPQGRGRHGAGDRPGGRLAGGAAPCGTPPGRRAGGRLRRRGRGLGAEGVRPHVPHRRAGARPHRPDGPGLAEEHGRGSAGHLSGEGGTEGRLPPAVEPEDLHGAHSRGALRSDRRPLPRGGGGPRHTGHDGAELHGPGGHGGSCRARRRRQGQQGHPGPCRAGG